MVYTYTCALLGFGLLVFMGVAFVSMIISMVFYNDIATKIGIVAITLMLICGIGYCIFDYPSRKEIYNYGVERGYTFYVDGQEVDPSVIDPYDYRHINLPDDENQRIIIASTGR